MKLPEHIKANLKKDKDYYSLYKPENIERCKVDPEYLGEVLIANENLIWFSIHKYVGNIQSILSKSKIEKEDLLQVGRYALIKAIKAFDTSKNIKFSSFAVITIVREIKYFLKLNSDLIRLPKSVITLLIKIENLEASLGYLPSYEEIASYLNLPVYKVKQVMQYYKPVKYLEELRFCSPYSYEEVISKPVYEIEKIEDDIFKEQLLEYLKQNLTPLEYEILQDRLNNISIRKIKEKYNISQAKLDSILSKIKRLIENYSN